MVLRVFDPSTGAVGNPPRLWVAEENGTLVEANRALLIDGEAGTTAVVWTKPSVPVIAMSLAPAFGFAGDTGNIRITYAITSNLAVTARDATRHLADGTESDIPITVALSSVLEVPRPNQSATYAISATNSEGVGSNHADYEFRTALSGLQLSYSLGFVPGERQGVQGNYIVAAQWTGFPIASATVSVPGADPGSHDYWTNTSPKPTSANPVTRRSDSFTLAYGSTPRHVTATLTVVGVDANNAPVTMTATLDLPVPARGG